ncbi:MAG: MMPL family transporter [Candidatus Krumholzibacteriota bacterium]|nr:MMPL family transporter [Candidatus Krumholzibacteriota bacterium]
MKYALKYPKMVLAISLLITAAFFIVMRQNSRMETDLDDYMPQNHPDFVYSNKAEEWFNIKDGIIIAIENRNGIYNTSTLEKVESLTKKLQGMEEIEKDDVTSLYTADNIIGTDTGLDVSPFYRKVPQSEEKLTALRINVRDNKMAYERIVSSDETVTVIIAEIGEDTFSQEFYRRLINLAEEYEGPEKLYVAGRPIVEGTMAYLGPRDMKRMVPIVILVIIIVLLMVQRSIKAAIFTLLVVFFSVICVFGLMAAVGVPIYAVSTMIPVMLIAIGVADGIHLYSHLHIFMKADPQADTKTAVSDMLNEMWKPVVMTSVTTAVGFISLLTSEVYPIKYFGLFTAFGVLAAMAFSLFLIPAGLLTFGLPRWKNKNSNTRENENRFLNAIARLVIKHKYFTLVLTALIIIISIFGMTNVWINSSFLDKFEEDSDIVSTDAFINKHFGGTSTLNVILDSENPDAFKKPQILRKIDKLQTDVESSLQVVGSSFALTDYLERMNKVMHADSAKYDVIPESKELVAQYLLLYEMSGDPENLWKVVDYNYQKANLTFQLKSDNSIALNRAIDKIEEYKPDLEKSGVTVNYAGSGYKALIFTDLILEGQIKSLIISLAIVVLLLSLMFKNAMAGIIGSVPITITAVISFGVMGLLNIPLSTTTALLSSIAIGIGIDYAVHFIERYKIYAAETGDPQLTGHKTMQHSGRAIVFNALVVISGFLVLLTSVFPPNRALGALVSMNMFTSFLGTVTVMYLLLRLSNIFFKQREKEL